MLKTICIGIIIIITPILGGCAQNRSHSLEADINKAKTGETNTIYVQAAAGSFNHKAVSRLYQHEGRDDFEYSFSGTPLNTFENASNHNALAFVALRNDIISGHLVKATVDGLREYRVTRVTAGVRQIINMCLLRTKAAVDEGVPLKIIASHPAALAQINQWKAGRNLKEIEEPNGTSEAARILDEGGYSPTTGAIGPSMLENIYKKLLVVDSNLQDKSKNTTLFGRLEVIKRKKPITEKRAQQQLSKVIEKARRLANWSNK